LIAVDSSALIAILRKESRGQECLEALARDPELIISAATLAEVRIVARRWGVLAELENLLAGLPIAVIPADQDTALRVPAIHARWGKKNHAAELNIIDCFSYDVAKQFGCPLLYIGNDFSQTDIPSALA
jgi:ribonuclease VapC